MHLDTGDLIREYLAALDEVDPGKSRSYFQTLYDDEPGAMAATVRNIEDGLAHFPPGLVIDVGCGHGLQAYAFTRHGRQVIGIDNQRYRVERARAAAELLGVEIEYRHGDATDALVGLRAGAVWLHRSINHLPDLPRFFAAVHPVVDPDGALVFVTSNARSRRALRFLPFVRPGRHELPSLTRDLIAAGFVVADVDYHGYSVALPARIRPNRAEDIDRRLARTPGIRTLAGSFTVTARPG